jgi:hypothetical protein
LDSLNNDCLQCCDLLLGASSLVHDDPTVRLRFQEFLRRHQAGEKLRDSEVKQLIAGYLARKVDGDATKVYDPRVIRADIHD